ncbi:TerD family protein [Thermopolyspora sp. NPDC052614]|uniref:TerD family protein n=1 Tax=Thermopolyspora sp. NPDC052614 TaxID=3155682 RepID=UPI0034452992
MSVNLAKGGDAPIQDLTRVLVALGWRPADDAGPEPDLDASALLIDRHGMVLSEKHFVFYHNLKSPDGSVVHEGDERVGVSGRDCEVIRVDLEQVPPRCARIVFPVSIYNGETTGQNFGQVRDAYIRVVDQTSGDELVRYDLTEEAAKYPAIIFGELFRKGSKWHFRAIEEGFSTGLRGIVTGFGVDVAG